MSNFTELTKGCLAQIMSDNYHDEHPVLQVLGTKRVSGAGGNERYRLLLSDGQYLQSFAMLSTQLNDLVVSGSLSDHTIIRVKQHITSVVNKTPGSEKRVLIIVNLEVLHNGAEVGTKIGDPVSLDANTGAVKTESASAPAVVQHQPALPARTNSASGANSTLNSSVIDGRATHPINSLSPYQNKWVIKARVTAKSTIRTWSNAKGEGKLFSMDLMDESGQIRATVFQAQVDKYYDMIEVDKVYYITKCQVKPANKQYSKLPNDYEMTFTAETVVQECEDVVDIPTIKYDFKPISQIAELEANASLDVIGVCKDVGDVIKFTAKASGRELIKRDITLVDNSNAAVTLTLWGKEAEDFNPPNQPVVLVKDARINEFNGGKTLSVSGSSVLKVNPDCVEGHRLRGWFENGGGEGISASVSARSGGGNYAAEWMTFHDAKLKNLGNGDKPDYFQLRGTVHLVKSNNAFYKACPTPDCNKKVVDNDNGMYRCEKCNAEYPNFKYRMMVNMSIADWTSNRWATCFADTAESIIGKTSQEVGELFESNQSEGEALFGATHFKQFVFKLRTKVEFYGDTSRNKITVQSAAPTNYKEYNEYLIQNIQKLTGIRKQ